MHAVFQQVYESVEFAKLKLLARALERARVLEGGRIVVSYLLRTDFAEVGAAEPYSEGIIDYLRAVEGARARCAHPRAAARRRAGAARLAARERSTSSTSRAIARLFGGGGHRQAAGLLERRVDRRDHRAHPAGIRRTACRRERLSLRASRSSTSPRARRRSRSSRRSAA